MSDKNKTLDLTKLDSVSMAEEGAPLEIIHPVTKEPLGIIIHLCGSDSKRYRDRQHAATRKRLRGARSPQHLSLEAAEADAVSILAACTVGWEGMEENGKPVDFSEANAKDIYIRYPVICEQVSTFIEDRRNFLPTLDED